MKKTILSVMAMSAMLLGVQAQTEIKTYDACDADLNDEVNVGDAEYVANHVLTETASSEVVTAADLNALLLSIDKRLTAIEKNLGINNSDTPGSDDTPDTPGSDDTPDTPETPAGTASFQFAKKTLHVGETFTQELTTTSDGTISYQSSDPSVATVNAVTGLVTAMALGEATITATASATATSAAASASYTILVEAQNMMNGHEYVDLGVVVNDKPVYWAKTNVGAEKPADYGDYYAWGETETKEKYTEKTYQYYQCVQESVPAHYDEDGLYYPATSEKWDYIHIGDDISGSDFDVAYVKWQGDWRMPTKDEFSALLHQCKWERVKMINSQGKEITGYKVSNKTDSNKYILLPDAPTRNDSISSSVDSKGYYWSSNISTLKYAWSLHAYSIGGEAASVYRYIGLVIRPVFQ